MEPSAPIQVVAAVAWRGDRVLVCRRPAHKRHGGLWEFPGGKLEPGETFPEAAARELMEELGVTLTSMGPERARFQDPGSPYVIHFHDVAFEGEPRDLEHEGLAWVPPGDLDALDLAPTDRRFARILADPGAPDAPP